VSADENGDLFWAIRGGGGNFGVVTEFEFRLHEVGPDMLGGDILWPIAQARELLEFFAEYSLRLSDEMYVGPSMGTAPDGAGVIGMHVCYCGDFASGERELAPLRQFGNAMADAVGPVPYVTLQTRNDGAWRPGIRSYVKGGMATEFTPGLIDAMIESFDPRDGLGMGTHTAGGAVARVGTTDTAWPHRNVETMINVGAGWTDPADDEAKIEASRRVWAALEPHTAGYYDNIQSETTNVSGNYGPAYDRLVSVKNEFDPMNLFRLNSNVRPTV
jgi:FAD/FMN-containing dehydrogenase